MEVWDCSVTRMIDNMLDVAHFPYTHAGTFGREQEQVGPELHLEQLDDTFYGYNYASPSTTKARRSDVGWRRRRHQLDMSTGFALPFSVRSTMSYSNGIEQTLFMTASPISDERSYFTFVLWRNDDVSTTGQDIVDFEQQVARRTARCSNDSRASCPSSAARWSTFNPTRRRSSGAAATAPWSIHRTERHSPAAAA